MAILWETCVRLRHYIGVFATKPDRLSILLRPGNIMGGAAGMELEAVQF